jgi:hypothetical protein
MAEIVYYSHIQKSGLKNPDTIFLEDCQEIIGLLIEYNYGSHF